MGHLCVGENNLHADACGHGELKHVDDDSGNVTEKKDNDNADENTGKTVLLFDFAVDVGPGVTEPEHKDISHSSGYTEDDSLDTIDDPDVEVDEEGYWKYASDQHSANINIISENIILGYSYLLCSPIL